MSAWPPPPDGSYLAPAQDPTPPEVDAEVEAVESLGVRALVVAVAGLGLCPMVGQIVALTFAARAHRESRRLRRPVHWTIWAAYAIAGIGLVGWFAVATIFGGDPEDDLTGHALALVAPAR